VLERVLDVRHDPALEPPQDQAARFERVKRLPCVVEVLDSFQDATPERLPDHRGAEQRPPGRRRERVDPRRDRRSDGRRQLLGRRVVDERCHELLDEQRIAPGGLDDAVDGALLCVHEQRAGDARCLVRGEWREWQGGVPEHARAPRRPPLDELGPREREEHHRVVPNVGHEVIDQVKHRVIRPVQVLEHEQERVAFGHVLDEPTCAEQQMDLVVWRRVEPEPEEHRQEARGLGDVGLGEE
jgi:hypothetical protein